MNCILSSAYLAPISYYKQLIHYENIWIEVCDNYHKQSYRNRCTIASSNGLLPLSIPIAKPEEGKTMVKDTRISDHGNWRHKHWHALQSAYMNSPFFEYYADDFAPFYYRKWIFLADFNEELQSKVCELIGIFPCVKRTSNYETTPQDMVDYRDTIHPRRESIEQTDTYFQVFSSRFGFIPDLSIVDLLFNMGPESILYI